MDEILGMPPAASAHAGEIDAMMGWLHLLMLLLLVGWGLYFVYVLFRFRGSKNPKADYRGTQTHVSSWIEGAVAVAEAVLLFGFSIPLWAQRVDVEEFPAEKEATVVRVVAEQFAWNVHYPGADGIFGRVDPDLFDLQLNPLGIDPDDPYGKDDVTALNQLHLPVDKPAIIRLTSKDVIHSFTLNEMRVKQDTIPGMEIPLWFVPTVTSAEMMEKAGYNYEIACAQLCGIGHATMRGFVTIETQEEFDQWIAQRAAARSRQSADPFAN